MAESKDEKRQIETARGSIHATQFLKFLKLFQPSQILLLLFFLELLKQQIVEGTALTKSDELPALDLLVRFPDFFADSAATIEMNPILHRAFNPAPFHITVKISLFDKLTYEEIAQKVEVCEQAFAEILRENVAWLPRGQILSDLEKGKLTIFLDLGKPCSRNFAKYDGISNKIYLYYHPNLTVSDYKKILLNEFASYKTFRSNARCGVPFGKVSNISIGHLPYVYINTAGKAEGLTSDNLVKVLNKGIRNFDKLKDLWRRRTTKLMPAERALLHDFLLAVRHFNLSSFHEGLPPSPEEQDRWLASGIWQRDGVFTESGPKWSGAPRFFKQQEKDGCMIGFSSKQGRPIFLKDRVYAFFERVNYALEVLDFNVAEPKEHEYRDKTLYPMEFESFMLEFPEPLLQLIFPDLLKVSTWDALRCSTSAVPHPPVEEEHIETWKPPTL